MKNARRLILCAVPILFALFSVAMGKDANWDFLNYRWYTPYAFLQGRLLRDVLVAEHATFYNPLLELPFYLTATYLPAMGAGFLLALAASISFVPLTLLAEQCVSIENERRRFFVAAGIALCGLLGGGVLGQIGIVSWDLPLATPTVFALYLLLRNKAAAFDSPRLLCAAGLLAGVAPGLKLTAALYPLGMAIALLAMQGGLKTRLGRVFFFSIGAAISMALLGGYWMWQLYAAFGNPVFPYFNDAFHSPFAAAGGNRDGTFLPQGFVTALIFPFLFSANSLRVAEYHFRDIHIALAYALIALAIVAAPFRKKQQRAAWFLFIFAAVSFAAWEYMFAIYRYILPLELLSPLLIVLAVGCLNLPPRITVIAAVTVLVFAQCLISTGWNRKPWDRDYVSVQIPKFIQPKTMVLMTGNAPMGFVVPYLPEDSSVLRPGSYLADGNRFATILQQRIATATDPMAALFAPGDEMVTMQVLSAYGLAVDYGACAAVTSNVADPLRLCPVLRK
jgi:hypothetical protein